MAGTEASSLPPPWATFPEATCFAGPSRPSLCAICCIGRSTILCGWMRHPWISRRYSSLPRHRSESTSYWNVICPDPSQHCWHLDCSSPNSCSMNSKSLSLSGPLMISISFRGVGTSAQASYSNWSYSSLPTCSPLYCTDSTLWKEMECIFPQQERGSPMLQRVINDSVRKEIEVCSTSSSPTTFFSQMIAYLAQRIF